MHDNNQTDSVPACCALVVYRCNALLRGMKSRMLAGSAWMATYRCLLIGSCAHTCQLEQCQMTASLHAVHLWRLCFVQDAAHGGFGCPHSRHCSIGPWHCAGGSPLAACLPACRHTARPQELCAREPPLTACLPACMCDTTLCSGCAQRACVTRPSALVVPKEHV